MKKIFSLALASVCFSFSQAQEISGGLRTGLSHWMDKGNGTCFSNSMDGQDKTWDKQIFVRYKTAGKLAFESSIGHYSFSNYHAMETNDGGQDQYFSGLTERSQNIEWNISAQYELSCPGMTACPALSKLKSYVGVVATPTFSRTRTDLELTRMSDGITNSIVEKSNEFTIWTGLSHTLLYSIKDKFYLTSAVQLQIDPNRFFEKNSGVVSSPDSRFGLQIGVGYQL